MARIREPGDARLQALDRGIDVAHGTADRAFLAHDVPGLECAAQLRGRGAQAQDVERSPDRAAAEHPDAVHVEVDRALPVGDVDRAEADRTEVEGELLVGHVQLEAAWQEAGSPMGMEPPQGRVVDRDLAQQSKFSVRRAAGVMPDGTPFDLPADSPLPPPIDVPDTAAKQLLWLTMPLGTANAREVDDAAESASRYISAAEMLIDSTAALRVEEEIDVALAFEDLVSRDGLWTLGAGEAVGLLS